jgi:hypothetical protein
VQGNFSDRVKDKLKSTNEPKVHYEQPEILTMKISFKKFQPQTFNSVSQNKFTFYAGRLYNSDLIPEQLLYPWS